MKKLYLMIATLMLSGCSIFGHSGVDSAPYKVIKTEDSKKIELRHYEKIILVSASMPGGMESGKKDAFYKLFNYISGENTTSSKIAMTAPVYIEDSNDNKGTKIPMTAPVYMEGTKEAMVMSFVLPDSYSMDTAPLPKDPDVNLHEIKNYQVAVITFSGSLDIENIDRHREILETWISNKGYRVTGMYKAAGYNPPFTIPAFRRNEVLIPVEMN